MDGCCRKCTPQCTIKCEDCGLPYCMFALDVTLSNEQWALVHPESADGLLCGACIIARAGKRVAGVVAVRMTLDIPGESNVNEG